MRILILILGTIVLTATGLPLINSAAWWIRIFDFPRVQIAVLTLLAIIDFYGVHPEPPTPGTDTYERDTELLIIGKNVKETGNPSIVAGDMNDVGWSRTR